MFTQRCTRSLPFQVTVFIKGGTPVAATLATSSLQVKLNNIMLGTFIDVTVFNIYNKNCCDLRDV